MRLLLLLILAFASTSSAFAQGRAATEQRLRGLQAQINDVQQQVESARSEEQNAIRALNRLDTELTLREELVAEYREEADGLRTQTTEIQGSIDQLETEVEEAREAYRERAVHAYTRRRTNALAIIFSSASIGQMFVRARYLRQFAGDRRKRINEVREKTAALLTKNEELEESLSNTQRLINERQAERQNLAQRKSERSDLVSAVRARRGDLEAELEQRQKDAAQLQSLVRELIAAERRRQEEEARRIAEERRRAEEARRRKAERRAAARRQAEEAARQEEARRIAEAQRRPVETTDSEDRGATDPNSPEVAANIPRRDSDVESTPSRAEPEPEATETVPEPVNVPAEPEPEPAPETSEPEGTNRYERLTGSFRSNRGNLPWPARGTVTGQYGSRTDPDLGTTVRSVGIDIATGSAAPVQAVFQGVVDRIAEMPTYGTYIIMTHGSYSTVYGNLSSVNVRRGQQVQAGQTIARTGTSQSRRGSALFFAVFNDGQAVNPHSWLR